MLPRRNVLAEATMDESSLIPVGRFWLPEMQGTEEDWTGIIKQHARRKIQNRLNQRARRGYPEFHTTMATLFGLLDAMNRWSLTSAPRRPPNASRPIEKRPVARRRWTP